MGQLQANLGSLGPTWDPARPNRTRKTLCFVRFSSKKAFCSQGRAKSPQERPRRPQVGPTWTSLGPTWASWAYFGQFRPYLGPTSNLMEINLEPTRPQPGAKVCRDHCRPIAQKPIGSVDGFGALAPNWIRPLSLSGSTEAVERSESRRSLLLTQTPTFKPNVYRR